MNIKNLRIAKCSNSECEILFPINTDKEYIQAEIFCPHCSLELKESHLVQCEKCQSTVHFIPKFKGEETVIFYVEKCSICSSVPDKNDPYAFEYIPKSLI